MDKIRVAIVGGSGYAGAELLRLLSRHPRAEIVAVTSRAEEGKRVDAVFPHLRGHVDLCFSAPDLATLGQQCDAVFFATPHGAAMDAVPTILQAGARVIDLSADFRIRDQALWEQWYGQPHVAPQFLDTAVYGLPEFKRADIAGAQLIACPGCYPTSVELSLMPLLREGLIEPQGIIADCKSGVSGAGRAAKIGSLLCEAGDSFQAYASGGHRHEPEIEQALSDMAGEAVNCHFVPHLVPMIRGIHATVYADARESDRDLQAVFEAAYANEPFVDVLPAGSHPATRTVRGVNMARLSVRRLGSKVLVLTVIDNLVKGASGQAIQCFNIANGLPETMALEAPALLP